METVKKYNPKFIDVGVAQVGAGSTTVAMTGKITSKCFRVYNRGLTDTEVRENYAKTTFYHNNIMGNELK